MSEFISDEDIEKLRAAQTLWADAWRDAYWKSVAETHKEEEDVD